MMILKTLILAIGLGMVRYTSAYLHIRTRQSKLFNPSPRRTEVFSTSPSNFIPEQLNSLIRWKTYFHDGQFHNAEKHRQGLTRKLSDPKIWTHAFFVIAGICSFQNKIYELVILLGIMTPLSVAYHMRYEKPGKVAKVESVAAKLLFVYGVTQWLRSPRSMSTSLRFLETALMASTAAVYVSTNAVKSLYEPWHFLMHVIPSVWAVLVACNHSPLFPFLPVG
mmetsp:Transcript_7966/g.13222  ORF Transcript_7966/g.13222 Transcript_7966/m.13222 type:complete len:222 (-) Transcript_7966:177-842(-)